MSPRPARRRRRILLAAAAALTALVLLEGGARIAAFALQRERAVGFDPVLGWRMLPHVEKRGGFWSATEPGRTNAHGWRDVERTVAKPAGVRRIAALGDSFTFGQGVDRGDRWTDRVERATGWQVLNFGACAYGTDQEVLVYEHVARTFAPDAVLLTVFLGNDLDDIRLERQSGWSKPWFLLRDTALVMTPPERSWTTLVRTNSYVAEFALQAFDRHVPAARRAAPWREGDTLPLFVALVQRLARQARSDGTDLLVMLAQPCNGDRRTVPHERTDEVLRALAGAGVDAFDCSAAFLAAPDPALFLDDHHWSASGHELAARVLLLELGRRTWFTR